MKCPSSSKLVWSSPLDTNTANGDRASVVVKHFWYEDGRQEAEGDFLAKPKDSFGGPRHHYPFCPADSCERPVSNARFLPIDGEKPENFHWAIASDSKAPSHSPWIHASRLAGRSLAHARTPWDLLMAIGHGMLGACRSWFKVSQRLTFYQGGCRC